MCLIIATDGSHRVAPDFDDLYQAWTSNPDGGGVSWIGEDGNVHIFRSMDFIEWANQVETVWERFAGPKMLHVRWSTGGTTDTSNVHPFGIHGQAVAHNGHMAWVRPPKGWSDTRAFVRHHLKAMGKDFARDSRLDGVVSELLGGDRLAVLTPFNGGELIRFGHWEESKNGWHSNQTLLGGNWKSSRPMLAWEEEESSDSVATPSGWMSPEEWSELQNYLEGKNAQDEPSTSLALVEWPSCPICSQVDCVDPLEGRCMDCQACVNCFKVADCECTQEQLEESVDFLLFSSNR